MMSKLHEDKMKADPCECLNHDCMKHIFSFVGGTAKTSTYQRHKQRKVIDLPGSGPFWSVREAAKFCSNLSSVSRSWRRFVDQSVRSILSVPLDATLTELSSEDTARTWLAWLCRHKPLIGKLRSRRAWPTLAEEFTNLLLECNTSQLTHVELALVSCQIKEDTLQLAMAQQCPNLESVSIFVVTEENGASAIPAPGFLSRSLCSLPSLQKLDIWMITDKDHVTEDDALALNSLVRDLPGVPAIESPLIQRLAWQHTNELRYEPILNEKSVCLGLATRTSFQSPSFGLPIQIKTPSFEIP